MPEFEPPRVQVTLPGDVVVPGWLLGWQQGPDGEWRPQVAVHVPAAAVQKIPGEDYSRVPREPAPPRYVVVTDTRIVPPTAELHLATCWEIRELAQWQRATPVFDGVDAPDLLRFADTTRCPMCLIPEAGAPR